MNKPHPSIDRRQALTLAAASAIAVQFGCTLVSADEANVGTNPNQKQRDSMNVHYLEIVTKDVDAACSLNEIIHGIKFGEPIQALGGARTAQLANGGKLGIRKPMHEGERPVTRAYVLVDDINSAVAAAEKAGAVIAVPPMNIEGHGKCAIYFLGGIEAGLWQL